MSMLRKMMPKTSDREVLKKDKSLSSISHRKRSNKQLKQRSREDSRNSDHHYDQVSKKRKSKHIERAFSEESVVFVKQLRPTTQIIDLTEEEPKYLDKKNQDKNVPRNAKNFRRTLSCSRIQISKFPKVRSRFSRSDLKRILQKLNLPDAHLKEALSEEFRESRTMLSRTDMHLIKCVDKMNEDYEAGFDDLSNIEVDKPFLDPKISIVSLCSMYAVNKMQL